MKDSSVKAWLEAFASFVRGKNFDDAEALFKKNVTGFGTIAASYSDLEEWNKKQWRNCWNRTEGFAFDPDSIRIQQSKDETIVFATAFWSSTGIMETGKKFSREGRATIILEKAPDSRYGWLGIHNHYSKIPRPTSEDF